MKIIKKPILVIGPSIAYIPLTQGQYSLISVEDLDLINNYNWFAEKHGRSFRVKRGQWLPELKRMKGIHLHNVILEPKKDYDVDHKDGNSLNNHKYINLRYASKAENGRNKAPREKTKTGVKGVYPTKYGRFHSSICIAGKAKWLGTFDTIEEASNVYQTAASKLFGEFARKDASNW